MPQLNKAAQKKPAVIDPAKLPLPELKKLMESEHRRFIFCNKGTAQRKLAFASFKNLASLYRKALENEKKSVADKVSAGPLAKAPAK